MARQILVVDDDALLRRSLAFEFGQAGFSVATAASAEEALLLAAQETPDLVLLDIGLPGMDGLEAFRSFERRFTAPIIFLTARRRPLDEVEGLDLGAHDYITKPFDTDVLIARVKNALRRSTPASTQSDPDALVVGDLFVDPVRRLVTRSGARIDLAPRLFDLLYVLASHPEEVIPAGTLLERVWGAARAVEPQVLYVHLRWLREKLEEDPDHPRRIITVHRVGYKLVVQEA